MCCPSLDGHTSREFSDKLRPRCDGVFVQTQARRTLLTWLLFKLREVSKVDGRGFAPLSSGCDDSSTGRLKISQGVISSDASDCLLPSESGDGFHDRNNNIQKLSHKEQVKRKHAREQMSKSATIFHRLNIDSYSRTAFFSSSNTDFFFVFLVGGILKQSRSSTFVRQPNSIRRKNQSVSSVFIGHPHRWVVTLQAQRCS